MSAVVSSCISGRDDTVVRPQKISAPFGNISKRKSQKTGAGMAQTPQLGMFWF